MRRGMQGVGTIHFWAIGGAKVEDVLVGEHSVCQLVCGVEDTGDAKPAAAQSAHGGAYAPIIRGVAPNASHVALAARKPLPVLFTPCHDAIAARGEHELLRASLDKQPRCQQAEAAQAAGEEVRAFGKGVSVLDTWRHGSLSDHDGLTFEKGVALHAVAVLEAVVGEDPLPLRPAEQRTVLPDALLILGGEGGEGGEGIKR